MSLYIGATYNNGIILSNPSFNPVTVGHTAYVKNYFGDGIFLSNAAVWTITNYGTVKSFYKGGAGIDLRAGGTVTNATSAWISGALDGVFIYGGAGTISNAAGAVISGGLNGAYLVTAASRVENSGTIAAPTIDGHGVYLTAAALGATVTNAQGGLIYGGLNAVRVFASGGAVTNSGTLAAADTNGIGVALLATSVSVSNASVGTITGGFDGVAVQATYGIIRNSGGITGLATTGAGVALSAAHNKIFNDLSGVISSNGAGINVQGTAQYLNNSGMIQGATFGIIFAAYAGTVRNSGTIQGSKDGLYITAGGATITNYGTVEGIGSGIKAAAVFLTGIEGTVANSGTIEAPGTDAAGLYINSGAIGTSVTNAAGARIAGGYVGVDLYGNSGLVSNLGTIAGKTGVYMKAGAVVNGASGMHSALISGSGYGIKINYGGFVSNFGSVAATAASGVGVAVRVGAVENYGRIEAGTNGIGVFVFSGAVTNTSGGTIVAPGTLGEAVVVRYGTFYNYGAVTGSVVGIAVSAGTADTAGFVNVAGTVSGATGIDVTPNATVSQTVTVFGTVNSTSGTAGTAVSLGGGTNRLILAPGAKFQGTVDGGGDGSVLEIAASAGSGLGGPGLVRAQGAAAYVSLGSVTNFSALQVDPSATLDGSGVLSFGTLTNEGQVNIGSGNSLALGVVASAADTGTIDLQTGGMVDFQGAVANQTLIFQPPGGIAEVDHPEVFSGTISGFTGIEDIIDLTLLSPVGASATLSASDQLMVSNGIHTVTLQLDTSADYSGITWQTSADGSGGTDVAPMCFCRGTLILTDTGEVEVEALAVGDRVKTLSGAFKPIVWIGFGRDLVTQKNPLSRPIVVRQGALADNVPRRDLYLTHGHALYFDGVLIPVANLVNHRSIRWDDEARVVEYFHIELEDHDVVFAAGAAVETYYDADNRALFHNTRPGSAAGKAQPTFAPVLHEGEIVGRIWAALDQRAGDRRDGDTTDDPDLHLVVNRARLNPITVADGLYTFALDAPPVGPLRLSSRSGVPSLLGFSRHEHRRLGVAIRQIILYQPGVMSVFDHDAPLLGEGGCHAPESTHTWTDGEFALPARLFTHLAGPFTLAVHTARHSMGYPISHKGSRAA